MDRQRFEAITAELMERAPRSRQYRERLERDKKRGRKIPECYEECMGLILKSKHRSCEDCHLITTNNTKIIYREEDKDAIIKWWKKCDECGKKFLFRGEIIKNTK